jgi:hypothetical protein
VLADTEPLPGATSAGAHDCGTQSGAKATLQFPLGKHTAGFEWLNVKPWKQL